MLKSLGVSLIHQMEITPLNILLRQICIGQEWAYIITDGHPDGHQMHTHIWYKKICATGVFCTDSCIFHMGYGQFVDNTRIDNACN